MARLTREQATVKLDIDAGQSFDSSECARRLRRAGYRWTALSIRRSPSGKGWHVALYILPRPTCPFEVVALQLLLGGDANREAMQMHRAQNFRKAPRWMRDAWNVLYKPHVNRQRHVHIGD